MPWKKKFSYRQKTCYAITKLSSWSTLSPMMAHSKCLENSITAEQVLKTEWCFSPMQEENLFHSKMVHVRAGYLKSYWTCGDPHTCMWACRVEELCWGEQTAIQKGLIAPCVHCPVHRETQQHWRLMHFYYSPQEDRAVHQSQTGPFALVLRVQSQNITVYLLMRFYTSSMLIFLHSSYGDTCTSVFIHKCVCVCVFIYMCECIEFTTYN